jgi:putative ABC transport system permease protein
MTVLVIALAVSLFLSVEKLRASAKSSFTNTISGTDLIVGPRTGSIQLLLYSIFRIGDATSNLSWASYSLIKDHPSVGWSVPLSLGDSHKQFRLMGTSPAFFEHYKFRHDKSLSFKEGNVFLDLFDTVIGSDVAEILNYSVDDPIIVSHGLISLVKHENAPFKISGVLEKTGTPIDRTVIVKLEGIEAIHVDWRGGAKIPGRSTPIDKIRSMDLTPKEITAVMIGVKSPLEIFSLQRVINRYEREPLMAILPGLALQELWEIVSVAETALFAVSVVIVFTALIGMMASTLSSLNERRREMAILRSVGANPTTILGLFVCEATIISLSGSVIGFILAYGGLAIAQPVVDAKYGIWLSISSPTLYELYFFLTVISSGILVSAVPAIKAYRISLADGLTVKL